MRFHTCMVSLRPLTESLMKGYPLSIRNHVMRMSVTTDVRFLIRTSVRQLSRTHLFNAGICFTPSRSLPKPVVVDSSFSALRCVSPGRRIDTRVVSAVVFKVWHAEDSKRPFLSLRLMSILYTIPLWPRTTKNPDVLGHSSLLIHLHRSLLHFLRSARFASLAHSLPSSWESESLDAGTTGCSKP